MIDKAELLKSAAEQGFEILSDGSAYVSGRASSVMIMAPREGELVRLMAVQGVDVLRNQPVPLDVLHGIEPARTATKVGAWEGSIDSYEGKAVLTIYANN